MIDQKDIERVLVVTAHPDDVDFGAGGTVAMLTDSGVRVSYCICTNGDAGGFDPAVPREQIAGIRQREQRAAGAAVGVKEEDIHFLGYADGSLEVTMDLRRDISRVIRQVKPQVVITQSSERNYERIYGSHPDHMAAGEAALCAVYPDARNPFTHVELMKEGFQDWAVPETWIVGGAGHVEPNKFFDTTDYLPRKIDALLAHVSQTEHVGEEALRERIMGWNGQLAKLGGLPEGRIAEAFLAIDTQ